METANNELPLAQPATTASVAQPQSMAGELAQLKELTGGNPVVTVILAAVVILGSGAGWKFWQKKSEQKHELEMKKLELQAQAKKAESKAKGEKLKKKAKEVKGKK
jgi:predicted negative regulator of RcsB-dependent stress response